MTKMRNPEDSRPSYFSIRSIETLQNIHEFPSIVVISSIKHTAQIFSKTCLMNIAWQNKLRGLGVRGNGNSMSNDSC